MKIVSWNINSIKSRLELCTEYLRNTNPDVVLLQELKCEKDKFPFMEIEDLGYNIAVNGQKTYNGVAILSKYPIDDIITSIPENSNDPQARYIEAVITKDDIALRVASVYVPNGQAPGTDKFAYKLDFFNKLSSHLNNVLKYEEILVIGGDYNVAPDIIDVYDPKGLEGTTCFHRDEREKFRGLLNLGLYDAFRAKNPDQQQFSWWDYRGGGYQNGKGMRIDHFLLSPEAVDKLAKCSIDESVRGKEKPSDHAPVVCELEI